ncbi:MULTISPECIES: M48 family metallopeptidase [unclassified Sphingopyxis]|uniref:M48 family metallopeptidase n=1 Tax=unclassified Sphingopyxis TaxID=2614943 RepID=UPI00072FC10C|nr:MULTISPECIES: M48 family metallopeptidase [unclassified Sphingopyxis]KTE24768.1 peptidase M48 [Sphingopyxis sp. H057]KTE50792.1 peptidase M48 [Sphingopyxis sp. H073]KTE51777.1 peptidase M48 [Sphingopyxis sp. H071]KTE56546.1 peptidase M48 [Sphingopyxis sp. H107]KTE64344.1 peptidase M48 [Sphingopyxis sp. H100]
MSFDPAAATKAYIDALGPEALAKAADYTHGSEWLSFWGVVVAGLVTYLFVRLRILDRIDAKLGKRGFALRTFLVCAAFLLLSAIVTLPWELYTGWWRETAYGRTSQPLGDYLGQGAISLVIGVLLGALFFLGIYALIRRAGKRWWIWSGGLAAAAISLILLLAPVVIEPLFNDYKPVPAGPVRDALVVQAKEAGIDPDRIYMFDGSRQSNNFTANVSGLGHSARIAISDVALKGASLDEVKAVTGHEIGHYVLGHVWIIVIVFSLLAVLLFFLADRLFPRVARAFGSDAGIGDPRGFPVLMFLLSLFAFLAQPVLNTLSRTDESAADAYSLQTVNLPDALASALVKTAEYRSPRPNAVEEFVFYSHPSVERRVRAAMEWKAAHPPADK